MNEDGAKRMGVLDALESALQSWTRHGNEQPLTRWLERQLDPRGMPINLPIPDWRGCVNRLLHVCPDSRAWPLPWREPITRLVQATCRFTRRDGTPVIEVNRPSSPPAHGSTADARTSADATVSNGKPVERIMEQILATCPKDQAGVAQIRRRSLPHILEALRPGWPPEDDFLAIHHRAGSSATRFELYGAGRCSLGPTWTTVPCETITSATAPRLQCWIEDSSGALAEWSYRAGEATITQSALILAKRSLALLSTLIEFPGPREVVPGMTVSIPPQSTVVPIENCRGVLLRPANNRGSTQVLPIGLPCLPYPTDRGSFLGHSDELVLKHAAVGRRAWLPLVVSWDAKRHRKDVQWRVLTVSEKSRNVTPDRAFAARLSWGRDETYVIYRSFVKPASRAFLGHQTTTRFLIGSFSRDAVVEPILKVD
jgi:hypothetical protein